MMPRRRNDPSSRRPHAALFALAWILAAAGCTDGKVRKDALPDRPPVSFRMVVLTDLLGTLEPCGCTSRPLGGIDKLAARIAELRRDGPPLLVLAAGDLLFPIGASHGGPDAEAQEIWKAETLLDILGTLGTAAITPSVADLRFGASAYQALTSKARFPVLDGPPCAPAETLTPKTVVRDVGGVRVGIFGVTAARGEHCEDPVDLATLARRGIEAVNAEGAEIRIALVAGDRRDARQVAILDGVDFVVLGGLQEAEPAPPTRTARATILTAGRQGAGLLVLDVWSRKPGAPYVDVGGFRGDVERKRLLDAAKDLEHRIASWEKDPAVRPDDLADQRARLANLKAEAKKKDGPLIVPEGNAIAAQWVELPPEAPSNAEIRAVMTKYDRRVNEHNRRAFEERKPSPVAEGAPFYVGSAPCAACHTRAYEWWKTTPHGRAYATLEKRHKEFNLSCVGCHVTGYEEPGGSTVAHVEGLENVGCESCHGPGSRHVDDPRDESARIVRNTQAAVCVTCHNEEHSDLFEYEAYRRMLIVPGHGIPAQGGS